jgi:hypothetical protein
MIGGISKNSTKYLTFEQEAGGDGEDKKAGCVYAARNAGAGYSLSSEMPTDLGGVDKVGL